MNISSTKQFNQKEEQVQARHLAEMGILHYQKQLKPMVENHNKKLEQIAVSDDENKAEQWRLKIQHFVIVWIFQREIADSKPEDANYRIELLGPAECLTSGEVIVTIESTGTAGENGEALINAELTLKMRQQSFFW